MNTNSSKSIYFYIGALCNLKCNYCYISKNKYLKDIDDLMIESFKKDKFYLNLAKTYLEQDLPLVDTIEFWGAESTLALDRTHNTVRDFIEACPKLCKFLFSTNCTTPQTIPVTKNFLDLLAEYPDRKFELHIQISVDGPEEYTDAGRGIGTTKKIIENFNKLIESKLLFAYDNVDCKIHLKPTLNSDTLKLLENKENIIKYFQWFEDTFYDKMPRHLYVAYALPNLAIPAEYSSDDGKRFAKILALQDQIDKENKELHYFKYFQSIMLFNFYQKIEGLNSRNLCSQGGFCAPGVQHIGFLPDGQVCVCHRAFTNFIDSYCSSSENETEHQTAIVKNANQAKAINNLICKDYDDFKNFERKMRNFYYKKGYDTDQKVLQNTSLKATITNQVMILAASGQILPKYKRYDEAVRVANFFVNSRYPICMHANLTMSGINMCLPLGDLRMFCNGALDFILAKQEEIQPQGELISE